jgi:uncharacterized protein (TIGR03663 family)
MNRSSLWNAATMLAMLALAAAFRLPRLDQRPMHADEANQAVKAGRLYEKGEYEYDTTDHHGPSLYWLTLPSLWLSGTKDLAHSGEVEYRIVPAIFGIGLIPLVALLVDGLGWQAVIAAALLAAISPALIFYSRYYIQETLLVFFTLAALGCGWRYARSRRLGWILAAGAAVGMMHATKETWILSAAAAAGAMALTWGWSRLRGPTSTTCAEMTPTRSAARTGAHVLAAVLTGCVVAVAFFSMFGRSWQGPWQSIAAYANYFHRGRDGGHSEPWYYYLQLLFAYHPSKRVFWSEGFIAVLALVGAFHALTGRGVGKGQGRAASSLAIFLTFYTLLLTLLYSGISYKTPWCALSFLMAMILLAGLGTAAIFQSLPNWPLRVAVGVVLIGGAGHLGWQAWELNFKPRYLSDPLNPYVYAHTPMPLPRLGARLDRFADQVPGGHDLWIHVVVPENYWPLPWYLRRFNEDHVGYWTDIQLWRKTRKELPPPVILILSGAADDGDLANFLAGYDGPGYESLRPGVLLWVFVRKDLWPTYVECR